MLTWYKWEICVITDHSRTPREEAGLRSVYKIDFYRKVFSHRTGSSTLVVVADGLGKRKVKTY